MFKTNYLINQHMMYMVGFYDRNGKTCTLVREVKNVFIVDKSPKEILELSIKKVGFNLKGAMKTSRTTLGDKRMCPIVVNPLKNIVLFPTQSANRDDTIWFNPTHIFRTHNCKNGKTKVEFHNELMITLDYKLCAFNNKLQTAEQYRKMTIGTEKNPISFMVNPKSSKIFLSVLVALNYFIPSLLEAIS